MAFGTRLLTPTGEHIISQNHQQMVVLDEVTNFPVGAQAIVSPLFATAYNQAPMIAFKINSGNTYLTKPALRRNSSGQYIGFRYFNPSSTSQNLDYLVIGPASLITPTVPAGETHGMQVRDSLGSVVFDSRWTEIPAVISREVVPSNTSTVSTTWATHTITNPAPVADTYISLDVAQGWQVRNQPGRRGVPTTYPVFGVAVVPNASGGNIVSYQTRLVQYLDDNGGIQPASGTTSATPGGRVIAFRYTGN